jgi:hypothetical protein
MTTLSQEQAHKLAIVAANGEQQRALAAAKAAFVSAGAGPAAQPALDAAVKSADAAAMRALIASQVAQGLGDGGRQALFWLTGSYV